MNTGFGAEIMNCTCGGNNPNCFRCGGKGRFQPRSSKGHSEAYKMAQMLVSKPVKPERVYPVVTKSVKVTKTAPVKPERVKKSVPQIECPICCIFIPKIHLSFFNHLKSHNATEKVRHIKLISLTFKAISEAPRLIPKNNKPTYRNANPTPTYSSSSFFKANSTAEPSKNRMIKDESKTKRLDTTYGQHVFREGGKFGSHPSHDNFDDESGA